MTLTDTKLCCLLVDEKESVRSLPSFVCFFVRHESRGQMQGSVGVPCDDFCIRIVRTMTLTLVVVFLAILAGGMYDLSADVARILEAPD